MKTKTMTIPVKPNKLLITIWTNPSSRAKSLNDEN